MINLTEVSVAVPGSSLLTHGGEVRKAKILLIFCSSKL
jgi:hypothetical protein